MFPLLFHRKSTASKEEQIDITKTVKVLIDARFDRLEQKQKALELEWADVYDKIMLLYDRTRKRIAASKKASGEDQPIEPAQTPALTRDAVLRAYNSQNGV